MRAFTDFAQRPGGEIDLDLSGYLFLLTRAEDVAIFEASVMLQQELGVSSGMVSPTEAQALSPLLRVDDVLAGAFSPEGGHATPEAVVQGYASGASAYGAHMQVGCEVLDIETRGGEVRAVVTTNGSIETDTVVCAAGTWSQAGGAMVGVDLPVTPLRRKILYNGAIPDLPARVPMTVDFDTSFYFHREGPGLLMGMRDPGERPGFDAEETDAFIPALLDVAERRAPRIAEAGIKGGWSGFYEMSPDCNALIGEASSVSRFLYATGFSGHGFMQGPAVGEIVRNLVLDRSPFVDVTPLSADRFSDAGASRAEFKVV